MSYYDGVLFDDGMLYFEVTRYQLLVYQLLARLFIGDHMICTTELYELAEICTSYQLASY